MTATTGPINGEENNPDVDDEIAWCKTNSPNSRRTKREETLCRPRRVEIPDIPNQPEPYEVPDPENLPINKKKCPPARYGNRIYPMCDKVNGDELIEQNTITEDFTLYDATPCKFNMLLPKAMIFIGLKNPHFQSAN